MPDQRILVVDDDVDTAENLSDILNIGLGSESCQCRSRVA